MGDSPAADWALRACQRQRQGGPRSRCRAAMREARCQCSEATALLPQLCAGPRASLPAGAPPRRRRATARTTCCCGQSCWAAPRRCPSLRRRAPAWACCPRPRTPGRLARGEHGSGAMNVFVVGRGGKQGRVGAEQASTTGCTSPVRLGACLASQLPSLTPLQPVLTQPPSFSRPTAHPAAPRASCFATLLATPIPPPPGCPRSRRMRGGPSAATTRLPPRWPAPRACCAKSLARPSRQAVHAGSTGQPAQHGMRRSACLYVAWYPAPTSSPGSHSPTRSAAYPPPPPAGAGCPRPCRRLLPEPGGLERTEHAGGGAGHVRVPLVGLHLQGHAAGRLWRGRRGVQVGQAGVAGAHALAGWRSLDRGLLRHGGGGKADCRGAERWAPGRRPARHVTRPCQPLAPPPRSVSWSQRGSYLSIGTDKGEVQIWDATKCKR